MIDWTLELAKVHVKDSTSLLASETKILEVRHFCKVAGFVFRVCRFQRMIFAESLFGVRDLPNLRNFVDEVADKPLYMEQ